MGRSGRTAFTFTKEQLIRLCEHINNPKVAIGVFLARMIGLRIDEVCRLKWENLDVKNRVVTVLDSKWKHRARDGYGKDRLVRLPEMAVGPIERWRSIIGGGTWFLPSDKSADRPMRKKTLYEQFRYAAGHAGLDEVHFEYTIGLVAHGVKSLKRAKKRKLNFHSLRAYWVVDCRRRSIPLEIIAEQAGHADINTTIGYARYTDEEKNRILDRAYSKVFVEAPASELRRAEPFDLTPHSRDETPQLKPIEYLQMQLVRGEISEREYSQKLRLLVSAPHG